MLHCIINIKDEYYKTLINLLIRYISVINFKKKKRKVGSFHVMFDQMIVLDLSRISGKQIKRLAGYREDG